MFNKGGNFLKRSSNGVAITMTRLKGWPKLQIFSSGMASILISHRTMGERPRWILFNEFI